MDRTITYHITESSYPTIKMYLKTRGYSAQSLIALKKEPGALVLNGTSAYVNSVLSPGDILTIHISEKECSEKIKPVELPLHIVYEDEDLLVVNKPAGMPCHPSQNNYDNSLANALAWYFAKQHIPFVFRCINRLDKDTSGLTIIAKHSISAGILSGCHIRKEYLAIVRGSLPAKTGTISVPIGRAPGSIIERMPDPVNGEPAVTHYQVLQETNGHSLISLILETGRTHQIRVHMKYLGYPLIGDHLYNPDMEHIRRHALHAHSLHFIHPITGEPLTFCIPLSEDMRTVLGT